MRISLFVGALRSRIPVARRAQLADVRGLILRQGMLLAVIGSIVGLIIALLGARLLKTLLYGVSTSDPLTFSLVALLLLIVALLACWISARRAHRSNDRAARGVTVERAVTGRPVATRGKRVPPEGHASACPGSAVAVSLLVVHCAGV